MLDASDGGEKSQDVSVKGIESSCYGLIQRISGSLILFCTISCLTLRHVDVLCFCVVLKNVAICGSVSLLALGFNAHHPHRVTSR